MTDDTPPALVWFSNTSQTATTSTQRSTLINGLFNFRYNLELFLSLVYSSEQPD